MVQAGSEVANLTTSFDRAVTADEVAEAMVRLGPVDLVSVVHAEAATGVVNDLAAIAEVASSGCPGYRGRSGVGRGRALGH